MNQYQSYTVASYLILGAVVVVPLLALFLGYWRRTARFRALARTAGRSHDTWGRGLDEWNSFPGGQHLLTGRIRGRRVAVAEIPGGRSVASATHVVFGAETPDLPGLNARSRKLGVGSLFNLDSGISMAMDDPEIALGDPEFDIALRSCSTA